MRKSSSHRQRMPLSCCLMHCKQSTLFFLINYKENEGFFFFLWTGESLIHLGTGRFKIMPGNDILFFLLREEAGCVL